MRRAAFKRREELYGRDDNNAATGTVINVQAPIRIPAFFSVPEESFTRQTGFLILTGGGG